MLFFLLPLNSKNFLHKSPGSLSITKPSGKAFQYVTTYDFDLQFLKRSCKIDSKDSIDGFYGNKTKKLVFYLTIKASPLFSLLCLIGFNK